MSFLLLVFSVDRIHFQNNPLIYFISSIIKRELAESIGVKDCSHKCRGGRCLIAATRWSPNWRSTLQHRKQRDRSVGPLCNLAAASSAGGGGMTSAARQSTKTDARTTVSRTVEKRVEEKVSSSKSAFVRAARVRTRSVERRTRGLLGGCEECERPGGARGDRLARERRVTHSLRVTYTNRRTSRAGRQLATCSLLCSHTRARINLSVSCHVQRSHSLSPAAHRHSRPSCCRRLRAPPFAALPPPFALINKSVV